MLGGSLSGIAAGPVERRLHGWVSLSDTLF